MPVQLFRAENFRCLAKVELEPHPRFNLVYGQNASGKTSVLEAIAYLGRGKSFRRAPVSSLVRHGQQEFLLFGKAGHGERLSTIGIRNGPQGLETRVDGAADGGAAALAELLPLQVIDPDVHNLVAAGPEERRRYLDWIAFHVEHDFLAAWRRFRRALKQRNALLKSGGVGLDAWDAEFLEQAARIDAARRAVLAKCEASLESRGEVLLGGRVRYEYRSGWSSDLSLKEALAEGLERDLQSGGTQAGPHRADLRLILEDRQARRLVSRGQQKLLACSMILAATDIVQARLEKPMLLLLDDPAAELDRQALRRLMDQVFGIGCQVVATSLEPDALEFPERPATFHVKHGDLTRLD